MVNCNPETVSTDYDTSGRLYFEPLTLEDVLEVLHAEQASGPVAGIIVQLGGQTPLRLARGLAAAGAPVVGTSPEAIHLAEDRGEFGALLAAAGLHRAQARHRHLVRRGQGDRRRDRLPGARAALLRAGRPGHGDRLRRRHPGVLCRQGDRGQPRAPGPDRPLPRRRDRDRRGRALRRRGTVPGRGDGAHRGGRHPLRRLGLCPAADHPGRQRHRRGSGSPPR